MIFGRMLPTEMKESRIKYFLFLVFLIPLALLTFTCNKNNDNPVTGGPESVLIPLKTGNTWVWQISNIDTSGITAIDSMWVSQDTIIKGQQYFLLWE